MTLMKRFTLALLLATLALPAFGQQINLTFQPGWQNTITGCLYKNGHRDMTPGVPVVWQTDSLQFSGGHAHPDVSPNSTRPKPCVTLYGCTVYQDHLNTVTNSSGCSSVLVKQPWFAGNYILTPYVPVGYTSSAVVSYDDYISGLLPPFYSPGYVAGSTELGHPQNDWGNTVLLNDIQTIGNQFYDNTRSSFTIYRLGDEWGGDLDSFEYWKETPSTAEMHEDAQEVDITKFANATLNTKLKSIMAANRCSPSEVVVGMFTTLIHAKCF